MLRLTHITRENYTPFTDGYKKTGTEQLFVNPMQLVAFIDGKIWLSGGQSFEVTETAKQIGMQLGI